MMTLMFRLHFVRTLLLTLSASVLPLDAFAAPQWIWTSKSAKENEKATLRREFDVAVEVKSAALTFSCDNSGKAFINGKPAADNAVWDSPAKANVKALLIPGKNELRIDARNEDGIAAVVGTLKIEFANGTKIAIETGPDWLGAADGGADFKQIGRASCRERVYSSV